MRQWYFINIFSTYGSHLTRRYIGHAEENIPIAPGLLQGWPEANDLGHTTFIWKILWFFKCEEEKSKDLWELHSNSFTSESILIDKDNKIFLLSHPKRLGEKNAGPILGDWTFRFSELFSLWIVITAHFQICQIFLQLLRP